MWQFLSLGIFLGAPFELSRRLKTAWRVRRNLPVESPELPQPRRWTEQRDMSTHLTWRSLEQDLWADKRNSLSQDVWINDRFTIDTPYFRRMPKAVPDRREYIMSKYDGRYSFGELPHPPHWEAAGDCGGSSSDNQRRELKLNAL